MLLPLLTLRKKKMTIIPLKLIGYDCLSRGEYLLSSSVYAPWFRLHGRFKGFGVGTKTIGLAMRHKVGFVEFSITDTLDEKSIIIGKSCCTRTLIF